MCVCHETNRPYRIASLWNVVCGAPAVYLAYAFSGGTLLPLGDVDEVSKILWN